MYQRQSIIELFSTFLQFEGDAFGYWATDAKLRRSMRGLHQQTAIKLDQTKFVLVSSEAINLRREIQRFCH